MRFINKEQFIEKVKAKAKYYKKTSQKVDDCTDIMYRKAKWLAFQEAIETCNDCDEIEVAGKANEDMPVKPDGIVRPTANKISISREGAYHMSLRLNDKPINCDDLIIKLLPELSIKSPFSFGKFCSRKICVSNLFETVEMEFKTELNCYEGTKEEIEAAFKERIQRIRDWYKHHKISVIEFEI